MITVSILGCGSRGAFTYGRYMDKLKDKYKIVSLCDKKQAKLDLYGGEFSVSKEDCFLDENEFFQKKRSDLLIVATQDADHVRHALAGLKLGYHILLEKPISPKEEECEALLKAEKESEGKILVCHVLRYTVMIRKMKELLDSGVIGKLVSIDHTERIGYWHMAHSYVRGNWRREEETSPILMAKCCHDLDLIQYFAGSKCKTVSSQGALSWFKEENAPEGSANRCLDCKYADDCSYSAKKFYITDWIKYDKPQDWPYNVLVDGYLTEENLTDALRNGPYGRCVYRCDNDVFDNQHVELYFENDVRAVLKMQAFTHKGGREILLYGTLGTIKLDEQLDSIQLMVFGKDVQTFKISEMVDLANDSFGHGGGDAVMVNELYDMLTSGTCGKGETSLEKSIESHKIAFAANRSVLEGGTLETIVR